MPEPLTSLDLADAPRTGAGYDVERIREDFPILQRRIGKWPLVYLDSANTSQKPVQVVAAMDEHYLGHNANVARAMHTLGAEATEAFEGARTKVADFIGAAGPEEIVFTKNASEGLNLVAHSLGGRLSVGDEIVISVLEHHSNIVPWQMLAQRTGAVLRWFDITPDGRLDLEAAAAHHLINERTRIVSIAWVSNVLGTVNPIAEIAAMAHRVGAHVVVDGSQGVPQLPKLVPATYTLPAPSTTIALPSFSAVEVPKNVFQVIAPALVSLTAKAS